MEQGTKYIPGVTQRCRQKKAVEFKPLLRENEHRDREQKTFLMKHINLQSKS